MALPEGTYRSSEALEHAQFAEAILVAHRRHAVHRFTQNPDKGTEEIIAAQKAIDTIRRIIEEENGGPFGS